MLLLPDLIATTPRLNVGCADVGCSVLRSVRIPPAPLTEARFCDWIAEARVGDTLQYHEGFLLLDRSESSSGLSTKARVNLHALARRAWIACELGLVHLYSVRIAECHYRYLAVRSCSSHQPSEIRARLRNAGPKSTVRKPH